MCSAGVWVGIEVGIDLAVYTDDPLISAVSEMGAHIFFFNSIDGACSSKLGGKWWVGGFEVDQVNQVKFILAVHKLQANEGVGEWVGR